MLFIHNESFLVKLSNLSWTLFKQIASEIFQSLEFLLLGGVKVYGQFEECQRPVVGLFRYGAQLASILALSH